MPKIQQHNKKSSQTKNDACREDGRGSTYGLRGVGVHQDVPLRLGQPVEQRDGLDGPGLVVGVHHRDQCGPILQTRLEGLPHNTYQFGRCPLPTNLLASPLTISRGGDAISN